MAVEVISPLRLVQRPRPSPEAARMAAQVGWRPVEVGGGRGQC